MTTAQTLEAESLETDFYVLKARAAKEAVKEIGGDLGDVEFQFSDGSRVLFTSKNKVIAYPTERGQIALF